MTTTETKGQSRAAILTRAGILTGYDELARTLGLDVRALVRGVGLHRFNWTDPDVLIPAAAANELLERSAEAAGIEDFGLRLATTRNLAQLGAIGLIVREEPTVGHAIKAAEDYFRLHSETLSFHLDERDKIAVLRIRYLSNTQGRTRQSTELIVGTVFRTLNVLAGRAWAPESVCFAHPAPQRRTIHDSFFKTRTLFDSGFDGFVLRTGDLTAPIRTADAAMTRYIRHYVEEVMAQPAITVRCDGPPARVRATAVGTRDQRGGRATPWRRSQDRASQACRAGRDVLLDPQRGADRARPAPHQGRAPVAHRNRAVAGLFRAGNVLALVSHRVWHERDQLAAGGCGAHDPTTRAARGARQLKRDEFSSAHSRESGNRNTMRGFSVGKVGSPRPRGRAVDR